MSSIAYRTDEMMLQYHRSSGHSDVNFWRLSLQKFEKFTLGDYLFFIDPKSIHPLTRERGIVGYGRATSFHRRSPENMWDGFKNHNGFDNKISFLNRVTNYNKDDVLPDSIQSIYLEDVTYFSHPVYPSTVNLKISSSLESFTYLNEDEAIAIINQGLHYGIDIWAKAMNQSLSLDHCAKDIKAIKVRNSLENLDLEWNVRQQVMMNKIALDFRLGLIGYEILSDRILVHLPFTFDPYVVIGLMEKIRYDLEEDRIEFIIYLDKENRYDTKIQKWMHQRNVKLLSI